jgi:multiple sugar transport system substrate-binding protein
MMKTTLRIYSLLVILALLLTGCAPAATPAPTAEQEAPPEASAEKVTLSLWIFEGEEGFLPKLQEGFSKKFPNITLEITEIPESDYVTKIDTALAAGSPPDIAYIYENRWIKAGKFLAIDDMIREKQINLDSFNQGIIGDICKMDGKLYCVGTYTGAIMLFYNKDMFDAAGLPYPSATEPMTVDEYAELARKLAVPNEDVTKRIYGGAAPGAGMWYLDRATRFSADGTKIDGYLNDAETIHYYEVMAQLIKDKVAPSDADMQLIGDLNLFSAGKIGMDIIDNIIAINEVEQTDIRWGAAPTPVEKKGDLPFVAVWTDSFGVFSQSEHPKEALEFIAYMAQDGNQLRVEFGSYPLDNAVGEKMDWAGKSEGRQEAVKVLKLARPSVFVPGFWDATGCEWDAFNLVVEGQMTAKESLDAAVPLCQEALDNAWETWNAIK